MLDACFEHMKPVLAVSGTGSPLARLRRYVVYVAKFLASDDGVTMARLVTGIHDDKKLQGVFLERYVCQGVRCNAALSERLSRRAN